MGENNICSNFGKVKLNMSPNLPFCFRKVKANEYAIADRFKIISFKRKLFFINYFFSQLSKVTDLVRGFNIENYRNTYQLTFQD